jgi:hypothetical protein
MSGEDAPRPYLENLIVGATRNKNKQLSSHITTTSRRQHTRRRVITPRVKARAPNPASVPLVHPPDTPCQSPSTKSRICALGPSTRHPVSKPEHQIPHLCPWPSHPTPRVKARAPNPASVPLAQPPDTPCQSPSTKSRICALGPSTRHPVSKPEHQIPHLCPWPSHPTSSRGLSERKPRGPRYALNVSF